MQGSSAKGGGFACNFLTALYVFWNTASSHTGETSVLFLALAWNKRFMGLEGGKGKGEEKGKAIFCMCTKSAVSNSYTQVRCSSGGCIKRMSQSPMTSLCHSICSRITSRALPSSATADSNADPADTHTSDFTCLHSSLVTIQGNCFRTWFFTLKLVICLELISYKNV